MAPSYDAIVIGTGFGGSVAACRLAQAGLKVCVLERGRRYDINPFPRDWNNPTNGWLWEIGQGLFDAKLFQQMTVIQSAGLGGGSLIYANVHLRAPEAVFARGWPDGYSRAALDPYYDLVAYMLDINPITKSVSTLPAKANLMKSVAQSLGRSDQFCYPNIAVDLGPQAVHRNKFGADQQGCTSCGECDIGCNFHAKNTLDLNYLKVAHDKGAEISTQCEVTRIEPSANGYKVSFIDHAGGGQLHDSQARYIFVCAGAVNSTELMLKCRDEFGTLPKISARLGDGYSGNGDLLAFAFNTKQLFKPSEGPTITTGIVYDRSDAGVHNWFIFEEGGYPKEIGGLLQVLNPKGSFLRQAETFLKDELLKLIRSAASASVGTADPASDHTGVFLAMGRDLANGVIRLHPITHGLDIQWDVAANLPLYDAETRLATDIAKAMGANVAMNPLWRFAHLPVSVHNLGGCLMADSAALGVTDPNGEVYGYPGLFVIDGAILPAATGVNPSHTIAAVAERDLETFIRRLPGKTGWRAPETASVVPVVDPLSAIKIPAGGTKPTETKTVGIEFSETMKGYVAKGWSPGDDYAGAERAGQAADSRMDFHLTITMPDLDAFIASREHSGIAKGTVTVRGFTSEAGASVANGVFNLFVAGDGPDSRKMLYALPFIGSDGKPYLLDGFKDVRDHGHFDVWGSTSTLYTVIREGHTHSGQVVATGIIKILIPDFMKQLTTFEAIGTDSRIEKLKALDKFGNMFFGSLWDVFVKPHL
ncbi:MAG: GMC family oxidoreductase N-terminal domain-containing protein [Candidatus Binataceae bacterium]